MADKPLLSGFKPEPVRPVIATNGKCTDKDLVYSAMRAEGVGYASMYVTCISCRASKDVMFEIDKGSASMYFSAVHCM